MPDMCKLLFPDVVTGPGVRSITERLGDMETYRYSGGAFKATQGALGFAARLLGNIDSAYCIFLVWLLGFELNPGRPNEQGKEDEA